MIYILVYKGHLLCIEFIMYIISHPKVNSTKIQITVGSVQTRVAKSTVTDFRLYSCILQLFNYQLTISMTGCASKRANIETVICVQLSNKYIRL